MKKTLPDLYYLFFTILSAILLTLSFPKWNFYLIITCALFPVFFAISQVKDSKKVIILSLIFGIIHFFTLLYWIPYTLVKYGNIPVFVALLLLLLLSSYLAIYFLLPLYTAFKLNLLKNPDFLKGFVLALFFSGSEYLRSKILTGFPWCQLGEPLANFSLLLQSADIWGIWGLTLTVILMNYYAFFLIDLIFFQKNYKKLLGLNNLLFAAFFLILTTYGTLSKNYWEKEIKLQKKQLKVALLQGNVPQEMKEAKEVAYSLNVYKKLLFSAIKKKPDLILIPETALPFYFPYDQEATSYLLNLLDNLRKKSKELGKVPVLIFGIFRLTYKSWVPRAYNSLLVWDGNSFVDFYDKEHLVPFGEYIPLVKYFPFLKHISVVTNILKPGISKNLTVPLNSGTIKVTPLICFESAFSEILRKRAKKGTQLVIIATNDAWFDRTSAPYQHFQMAVIRAVEVRRFVVQVANTGISGIIDPTGKVLKKTPLEKQIILFGKVKLLYKKTLFLRYGNLIGISGALILITDFLIIILKKLKSLPAP